VDALHGGGGELTRPLVAKTLVTFFVSKLADNPSMMACTTALTVLTEAKFFGVGEGMEVTRG
jgi:hypothetical protein